MATRRVHRRSTRWNVVLAALCLLASGAFASRQATPPNLVAALHAACEDEVAARNAHNHDAEHHTRARAPGAAGHEGHCPFCFAAAFALEAAAASSPRAPPTAAPSPISRPTDAPTAPPRAARARAPPLVA